MADIFVSYSRADREKVAPVVALLEAQGWTVWWDTRLRAGEQWDEVIEREIKAARCVLVVWSPVSVTRYWVKVEANFALSRGRLVPVAIEGAEPPLAFTLIQTADLTGWTGEATAPAAIRIVEDVREKLAHTPAAEPEAAAPPAALEPAAGVNHQASSDWALIEASTDPRDFRAFLEEHAKGLLARRAANRLADLAELAWATARGSEQAEPLNRFLKLHFDSEHAETARAMLASLAAEERRIAEVEAAEGARREADEKARREAKGRPTSPSPRLRGEGRGEGPVPGSEPAPAPHPGVLPASGEKGRKPPPAPLIRTNELRVMVGPKGQEQECWLKPGESVRDLDFAPEMVLVPPGKFWMGSKDGEGNTDEHPRHEVTIGYPLLVGKYPVTFEEWDAFDRAGGTIETREETSGVIFKKTETTRNKYTPSDSGWGRGRRPVINVSWNDAKAYAQWLSETTGKTYRLLSEAEWEYCCRAGTETPFSFGETISTDQANYDGNYTYGAGTKGAYRQKTTEVGSFPANAFGLHDMHGNVWEWCEDPWHGNYLGTPPTDGSVRTEGGATYLRVLRGGSWNLPPWGLSSANRLGDPLDLRLWYFGFRLARTLHPTS